MKKKLLDLKLAEKFANELRLIATENQNLGGCGCFAREAFNFFTTFGYNPEIIIVSCNGNPKELEHYPVEIAKRMITNKSVTKYIPDHVILKVNKFYFDSDGYGTNKKGIVRIGFYKNWIGVKITLPVLEYLINNRPGWNKDYHRKNNKILKDKFKKLITIYNNKIAKPLDIMAA